MLKREIWTGTEIDAPAQRVWEILADLEGYRSWNPFIVETSGELRPGGSVRMRFAGNRDKPTPRRRHVLHVEPGRLIALRGHMGVPGIADVTHVIEVEPVDAHRTRVVQRARYSGVGVPF